MTGFKLSGVESDCSTNCSTTTAQNYFLLDYRSKAMLNLFMTSGPDDLHDQTKISSTNSASRWKSKNIF